VISRGEIVEQGTHAELIALGGAYKGLVEAQQISAEQKEGIEKAIAEGEEGEEAIDKLVRQKSPDDADSVPLGLMRSKSARSIASVEAERPGFASAGILQETHYSNYQLLRKVGLFGTKLIVGIAME
jgi:hypothetical protein